MQTQMPQPHTQAAPVPPVAGATYVPPSGQAGGQSAQHPAVQAMYGIAKPLEQAIPGYQIMLSIVPDLVPAATADPMIQTLREAIFHHGVALGSIRRFLCGEMTGAVIDSLAVHVNLLAKVHTQLRPNLERVIMAAVPEKRNPATNLTQLFETADQALIQAGCAIQAAMGQAAWDAVRERVWGHAEAATTADTTQLAAPTL